MPTDHKCQQRRVANSMGCVEPCACGGSNLQLGAITLHLERQQVADFLQLARGVQMQAPPPSPPAAPEADAALLRSPRRRRRGRIARVYH